MLYFRADANSEIGTGHVMRCLSIAKAMRAKGYDCGFITADDGAKQLLNGNDFDVICLDSEWNDLESEIDKLNSLIKHKKISNILIDSYFVTDKYLSNLRQTTKVIYIDDIDKFIYPVDILINYNIYAENMPYRKNYSQHNTRLLLGCDYAPLRFEFREIVPYIEEEVKDILISTGGADSYNIAGYLLEYFEECKACSHINFHVIVGNFNINKDKLNSLAQKYENIILHNNVVEMSKIISSCDIVISAGGTTLYEICACGVPAISYSLADNQLEGVKEFDRLDIIYYAGDIRDNLRQCLDNIFDRGNYLMSNYKLRTELSSRMKLLVDGYGADRLIENII